MRLIDADAIGFDPEYLERDDLVHFIKTAPAIDAVPVVRCRECIYYDPPHIEKDGTRYEYGDMPEDAFDELGTGLVHIGYGINFGGRCTVDYNNGYVDDKRVSRREDDFCSRGAKMDGGADNGN